MLEFEKKIILTEPEYRFLADNRYSAGKTSVHINYYYDSEDLKLNKENITYRIRQENNIFTATIKEHGATVRDCSKESSYRLRNRWDDAIFTDKGVKYQGSMKTIRTTYVLSPKVKIVLDSNCYLDNTDYELEIEYEKEAEPLAIQELNKIAYDLFYNVVISNTNSFIARVGQQENKSKRFFKRKTDLIIKNHTGKM